MTQLKTLKDLPCADGEDDFYHTHHDDNQTPRCIDENMLRTEAIKLWKEIETNPKFRESLGIDTANRLQGAQKILKYFFNLAEEELK